MPRQPKPPTRIQASGRGHVYYLDGEKVPGVTSILDKGVPKPGLVGWASAMPAEFVVERLDVVESKATGKIHIVADRVVEDALAWNASRGEHQVRVSNSPLPRNGLLEILKNIRYRDLGEAATKGTEVHSLAHRIAAGEEVTVPDHLIGHVDSYLRFLAEWQPRDALVERVIVNRRYRYMGKFDLLARFDSLPDLIADKIGKDEGTGLLDIKTARSGIFAEVALQLEGYRNGETMLNGDHEVPMPAVDFVAAIHVRADGYDVHWFDTDPSTFRTFLYCKAVGEWLDWKEGPAATIRNVVPAPTPANRQSA